MKAPDDSMVVQLTVAELRELVRSEVEAALGEARKAPALLSRARLAEALDVSLPTLDRLRAEAGFPELVVGEAPRFDLAAVLAWLKRRSEADGDQAALRVLKGGRGG